MLDLNTDSARPSYQIVGTEQRLYIYPCSSSQDICADLITGNVHFVVPFGRNRSFVGRASILEHLLERIPPSVEPDDCQRTALVGLSGVGKTQIALEAAFRVRNEHADCSIFWVPAIDATSFKNAYRNIGQILNIPGIDDDKADVGRLVKTALSKAAQGNWLLIIDNLDDLNLHFDNDTSLEDFLPLSTKGSILFTTRNHEIVSELDIPETNVITVGGMTQEEGLMLLKTQLSDRLMRDMESATELLDILGYLPLAIRQASAYMAKKQISTTKYLELCRSSDENRIALLSRDFDDRHRYKNAHNPVPTTWLISFRQIAEHNPLAADYLKFICFLSEKDIPQPLFPRASRNLDMEDAIGTLKAYAFITEREAPDAYDIHQLVQLATINWLRLEGEFETRLNLVMPRLTDAFPMPTCENKATWIRYFPHAR